MAVKSKLATTYRKLGAYHTAEPYMKDALDAARKRFGDDDSATQLLTSNLSQLYRRMGRNTDAEPLVQNLVESRMHTIGKEDPRTMASYAMLLKSSVHCCWSDLCKIVQDGKLRKITNAVRQHEWR